MNWYKIAQNRKFLTPSQRPILYQGDIEGMAEGSVFLKNVNLPNNIQIEIRQNNNDLYALINNKEVGFAQKMDDKDFDLNVVVEWQNKGIGATLMTEFLKLNPSYKNEKGSFTEKGYNLFQKSINTLKGNN